MDRIIDFNELRNKATDKEIDKFEEYIYSLYYSVANGSITMAEFSKKVMDYMQKNSISQEKFMNIQKEFMKRYGFDAEDLEKQMKDIGFDLNTGKVIIDYGCGRKLLSFKEKYNDDVIIKNNVLYYTIKNDKNNITIHIDHDIILIQSENSIDIHDVELNEFLCSYKKLLEDKTLIINICENVTSYNY